MAKKSRRARRQRTPRRPSTPSRTATAQTAQPSATPYNEQVAVVTPTARKQVDFSTEYNYVINDLRSMAMIAVAMLAVLIILSFLIR
jgi:hypothetical protein